MILAMSLLFACSPSMADTSLDVQTENVPPHLVPVIEPTPPVTATPLPPESMLIGRRYSFPNLSANLIVVNGTTQTLFLSTFPHPTDPSDKPFEIALIGMRYGRTYTFPDTAFGATYVLRDISGLVIAVYAVTSAPQQILRVTNLSLVAARAAEPVTKLNMLRSFWSGTAKKAALHFVNSSHSELLIYWVDFSGGEELKITLPQGQRIKLESRYGNSWSVRTQSGHAVMAYYVTEADSQVVEISDEVIAGIQPKIE